MRKAGADMTRKRRKSKPLSVLSADPTLDDMLAALLVELEVTGQPVPEGFEAFAAYAAVAHKGLYPGTLPPEKSLVGMYQAIRWDNIDLTEPDQGRKFASDWS